MIIELIILISLIIALILCLLKLFTHIFDNFENDIYTQCNDIINPFKCIKNINCELYNLGGNRSQNEECRQSGVSMGSYGNSGIIN